MNRIVACVGTVLLLVIAEVCPGAAAEGETTTIEEKQFRLSLPGQWTGTYDEESQSWTYHTVDGRDTVTVGILRRSRGTDLAEIRKDLTDYLRVRRAEEQKTMGPGAVIESPEIKEIRGALLARFFSYDAGHNHRGYTRIVVNKAAVACFYYESTGLEAKEFSAKATSAFAQIALISK